SLPRAPAHHPRPSFPTRRSSDLYSSRDTYGSVPYAYFSSYKTRNGYNRFASTDCPSLGVWPYAEALTPTVRYLNPNTFQIISAGDRKSTRLNSSHVANSYAVFCL